MEACTVDVCTCAENAGVPLSACLPACPCLLQIHQLNSTWSEARKASYVRHAVREYTIHKALHHRNIVSLTDIFEVRGGCVGTRQALDQGEWN